MKWDGYNESGCTCSLEGGALLWRYRGVFRCRVALEWVYPRSDVSAYKIQHAGHLHSLTGTQKKSTPGDVSWFRLWYIYRSINQRRSFPV